MAALRRGLPHCPLCIRHKHSRAAKIYQIDEKKREISFAGDTRCKEPSCGARPFYRAARPKTAKLHYMFAAVPLSTRAHLRFRAAALSLKRNAKRREREKMDFLELAKERYSVRKFSDKKVEREKLDAILEDTRSGTLRADRGELPAAARARARKPRGA